MNIKTSEYFSLNSFFEKKDSLKFRNSSFLITGGTGVLGFAILNLLKEIGVKDLHCLTSSVPLNYNNLNGVRYHQMDLRDNIYLNKNLVEFDYIIHAAGYAQPNKFMKDPIGVFKINVDATRILINKCKRGFGFISSSEIYSGNTGILNENSYGMTNPQHKRACYIESKRSGEFLTSAISSEMKINSKIFRVSTAFGPGFSNDDQRVLTDFIRSAVINNKIIIKAGAKQTRQVNYNFDAAQKILIALLYGQNNVYNISGNNEVTIQKMAEIICNFTKSTYEITSLDDNTGAPQIVNILDKNFIDEFKFNIDTKFDHIIRKSIDWFKKINSL